MKRIIMLCVIVLSGLAVQAQKVKDEQQYTQTLFRNPAHVGWYVAPEFAFTQFNNREVLLSGLSAGVIFNHNFSIGLGGYGIINSDNLRYSGISDTEDLYLYGGWGGLKLEYRINPAKAVHVSFPLLIGGGSMSFNKNSWKDAMYDDTWNEGNYATDAFFVVEPGVMMGLNLIKFMRLDIGVTYRYTPNLDLPGTGPDLINGMNAVASLKFGRF
jgi:hypothetical protein